MRVLAITAGSHGDVHPILALARALAARGHDAIVMTNPYFRSDVEAAGLPFHPHGEHIDLPTFIREHSLMHPIRGPIQVGRWLFELAPTMIAQVEQAVASLKPDLVLHHCICLGTGWVCRKHAIPRAVAALAPPVWWCPDDPVPLLQREPGPSHERRARRLGRLLAPLVRPLSSWRINRLRLRCGYPKLPDAMLHEFRSGDLPLGLWSPAFRSPLASDPPGSRIVGFPFYDGAPARSTPPELERFLSKGDPPILFALGTTAIHVAGEFYRHAAHACRRLGVRGVLLVGKSDNVPISLPPGVIAVPYAPFSEVMPRAALSVVHGGIGSVGQALASGSPTIVAPFSHDQFNNGVRVQSLGVGLTLGTRPVNVERLVLAVSTCLADSGMRGRAAALGARIRSEDAAGASAEAMERLVGTSSSPCRPSTPVVSVQ